MSWYNIFKKANYSKSLVTYLTERLRTNSNLLSLDGRNANEIINMGRAPEEWYQIIRRGYDERGTIPYWAIDWVRGSLRDGLRTSGSSWLGEAIGQKIINGDRPVLDAALEGADLNWAKRRIEKGDVPIEWIKAIERGAISDNTRYGLGWCESWLQWHLENNEPPVWIDYINKTMDEGCVSCLRNWQMNWIVEKLLTDNYPAGWARGITKMMSSPTVPVPLSIATYIKIKLKSGVFPEQWKSIIEKRILKDDTWIPDWACEWAAEEMSEGRAPLKWEKGLAAKFKKDGSIQSCLYEWARKRMPIYKDDFIDGVYEGIKIGGIEANPWAHKHIESMLQEEKIPEKLIEAIGYIFTEDKRFKSYSKFRGIITSWAVRMIKEGRATGSITKQLESDMEEQIFSPNNLRSYDLTAIDLWEKTDIKRNLKTRKNFYLFRITDITKKIKNNMIREYDPYDDI